MAKPRVAVRRAMEPSRTPMNAPRILVVAGVSSGVGKTTLTLGTGTSARPRGSPTPS
jgi:hypothetical protein